MAWTHVRHRVEDYSEWKVMFDSTADFKRSHGWKTYRLFAIEGDNTHVLVMEEFETPEQAREFLGSLEGGYEPGGGERRTRDPGRRTTGRRHRLEG